MNFRHPDRPAIGLCSHCLKGVCLECVTNPDHTENCLTCSPRCEAELYEEVRIRDLQRIIHRHFPDQQYMPNWLWRFLPAYTVVIGVVVIVLTHNN